MEQFRVAPSAPFHTGIDSSMMLAAAKPETASERSNAEFGIALPAFFRRDRLRGIAQAFQRRTTGNSERASFQRHRDAPHGQVGAYIAHTFELRPIFDRRDAIAAMHGGGRKQIADPAIHQLLGVGVEVFKKGDAAGGQGLAGSVTDQRGGTT